MEKVNSKSLDLTKLNIEKIKELFPSVVTEGKIDFDMLRTLLGDEVDDSKEKFQFTWKGKNAAIKSRNVTVGKLTLSHVAKFAKEMEEAGIHSDIVSPKLLPDYTRKRNTI